MKKVWSISTTVRNPERILPFLTTLSEMEGENFDEDGQIKFQTLLIKNKLYVPTGLTAKLQVYYEGPSSQMTTQQADSVFKHMITRSQELQKDPGLRGRTSVAPITKMGLAIATKSTGAVKITNLGRAFLTGTIDVGELYFRFFLKWQIPTPGSKDFSDQSLYNIKPFLGTLQLINMVNDLAAKNDMTVRGISKAEFCLFAPTLIQNSEILSQASKVIDLRRALKGKSRDESVKIFSEYSKRFAGSYLGVSDPDKINALLKTLNDYGDNIIKYFRLTRYIYIRGGGYYIDLEPRRVTEIRELLNMDAQSESFKTDIDYYDYLGEISQPVLPWANKDKLIKILGSAEEEIHEYEERLGVHGYSVHKNLAIFDESDLTKAIDQARNYRRQLQEQFNHKSAQSDSALEEYIDGLLNIYQATNRPLELERLTSLSLHALNDALSIKPNYPVGDDNEPTFTAPANVPDIECYYKTANAICEVTMLTSRDQWYNEGQPVMAHLRNFEDINSDKPAYCLFVAPSIHRGTLNTFWTSVKYEYEGKKQKIIPITIANFVEILRTLQLMRAHKVEFHQSDLFSLYDKIINATVELTDSIDWLESIPEILEEWSTAKTDGFSS